MGHVMAQNGKRTAGARRAPVVWTPWLLQPTFLKWLAYGLVSLPFLLALVHLRLTGGGQIYLDDDLALIQLHSREAVAFHQQLGPFDHFGWNHPGPAYFYFQAPFTWLLSSSARAIFVGATFINFLTVLSCVAVIRRFATPVKAVWAAGAICALCAVLAVTSSGALTYSEGPLGALLSPWNPMVVILPMLLLALLCAAAVDRSWVALLAALAVSSYVIQTDISTLPLAVTMLLVPLVAWAIAFSRVVKAWAEKRRALKGLALDPETGLPVNWEPEEPLPPMAARTKRAAFFCLLVLVLEWIPPLIQQFTNTPGNLTAIWNFFTAGHAGQSLGAAIWGTMSAFAIVVVGPGEVMNTLLGGTPDHVVIAVLVTVVTLAVGVWTLLRGRRERNRFALGLGWITLAGFVATVVAFTRVVGFFFGYLSVWAMVLPIIALIGISMTSLPKDGIPTFLVARGALGWGARPARREVEEDEDGRLVEKVRPAKKAWAGRLNWGTRMSVLGLFVVLASLASVAAVAEVAGTPSLNNASNAATEKLVALAVPQLIPNQSVYVGDLGAGTAKTKLIDVEEFIGLVNTLDVQGFYPKVNSFWLAQFGPRYLVNGHQKRAILLVSWSPSLVNKPGYLGRVGDIAEVLVLTGNTNKYS